MELSHVQLGMEGMPGNLPSSENYDHSWGRISTPDRDTRATPAHTICTDTQNTHADTRSGQNASLTEITKLLKHAFSNHFLREKCKLLRHMDVQSCLVIRCDRPRSGCYRPRL